jgi:thioredoxin reductase/Pyruvate/2-oxoacid:ferredoxin oxidoreductase delta subunit
MTEPGIILYALPMLLIWAGYTGLRVLRHRRARALRDEAVEAGLVQPASLHPVIDRNVCIGCRSCVSACPEQDVLGVIEDKAELVNPTHCIGHGACKTACPMHAIRLVFGTAERGIDIPLVSPDFETNVPGIYIAGELGGMGLVRNAIEQGRQAMESIARACKGTAGSDLDVVIVGAGPAGLSAALAAKQNGLRHATIEQDSLGGTVAHFPRGKIVMTSPVDLPIIGKVRFREISKEALLEFWEDAIGKTGIQINFNERIEVIHPVAQGFEVRTTRTSYRTRCVLLAIGRRGTPRQLGVPGEDSGKVVYRMIDPQQYEQQKVLIVGGGDSAIEAATSIAAIPGTEVTISYRSDAFSRAKEKNRQKIAEMENTGRLNVLLGSNVKEIHSDSVELEQQGKQIHLQNDAVIICAGGVLPTPFLKATGIEVETRYGT